MNRQGAGDAKRGEEPDSETDGLARDVLEAAVEVHRLLGPGYFEAIYEEALARELGLRGVRFVRQPVICIEYKQRLVGELRPDLIAGERLIVELKTVDHLGPVHIAQALSYLKATRLRLALLINFNVPVLLRGVRRVIRNASSLP